MCASGRYLRRRVRARRPSRRVARAGTPAGTRPARDRDPGRRGEIARAGAAREEHGPAVDVGHGDAARRALRDDARVRYDDAFRLARRAARVHDDGDVVRRGRRRGRGRAGRPDQVRQRLGRDARDGVKRGRLDRDDELELAARARRDGRRERLFQFGVEDADARARLVQRRRDALGAERRVPARRSRSRKNEGDACGPTLQESAQTGFVASSSTRRRYDVTTVAPWRHAAHAATIQFGWVSAKISFRSPGFKSTVSTSAVASAATRAPSSPYLRTQNSKTVFDGCFAASYMVAS